MFRSHQECLYEKPELLEEAPRQHQEASPVATFMGSHSRTSRTYKQTPPPNQSSHEWPLSQSGYHCLPHPWSYAALEPPPGSPSRFYPLPVQNGTAMSPAVRGPLTARCPTSSSCLLPPPFSSGTSCLSSFPIFVVLVTWPDS